MSKNKHEWIEIRSAYFDGMHQREGIPFEEQAHVLRARAVSAPDPDSRLPQPEDTVVDHESQGDGTQGKGHTPHLQGQFCRSEDESCVRDTAFPRCSISDHKESSNAQSSLK